MRLVTGFLRVKYLALVLGVAGIGIVSQANQVYLTLLSLSTLSMAAGIINRVRAKDRRDDPQAKALTQGTALVTTLSLSLVYLLASFLLPDLFMNISMRGELAYRDFLPVILGVPFGALAAGYFEGIYLSRDRFDLYIKASARAAVVELGTYLVLVYYFGIQGALIAIGASGPIIFLSFLVSLKGLGEPISHLFGFHFSWLEFRAIFKISFSVLIGSTSGYLVHLWLRGDVISQLGAAANGLLQPAMALSAYVLPFISNGIWGHLHPAGSANGDTKAGRLELSGVLQVVILLSLGASATMLTFGDRFVAIAYSFEFRESYRLFPFQFLGDYFYFIFYTLGAYFLSTSNLRKYVFLWVVYLLVFFVSAKLLIPLFEIYGYVAGHLISSVLVGLGSLFWLLKNKVVTAQQAFYFVMGVLGLLLLAFCSYARINRFWLVLLWVLMSLIIISLLKGKKA